MRRTRRWQCEALGLFPPFVGFALDSLCAARQVAYALFGMFELQFEYCIRVCGLERRTAQITIDPHAADAARFDGARQVAAVETELLCGFGEREHGHNGDGRAVNESLRLCGASARFGPLCGGEPCVSCRVAQRGEGKSGSADPGAGMGLAVVAAPRRKAPAAGNHGPKWHAPRRRSCCFAPNICASRPRRGGFTGAADHSNKYLTGCSRRDGRFDKCQASLRTELLPSWS